jgi:DNA-binding XRE family transcriptional regulator
VAQARAEAEEMDRIYAMNLAMIRKPAQMTQVEVARKLGVGQGAISRLENRGSRCFPVRTACPIEVPELVNTLLIWFLRGAVPAPGIGAAGRVA